MFRYEILLFAGLLGHLMAGCGGVDIAETSGDENIQMVIPATISDIQSAISESDKELVLAHIWATWCPPCVKEFPDIVALGDFSPSSDVEFVLVSADDMDDVDLVEKFMVDQGSPWGTYIVENFNEDLMDVFSSEWGGAIPATFFFDRKGELVEWWSGAKTRQEFEEAITRLLD